MGRWELAGRLVVIGLVMGTAGCAATSLGVSEPVALGRSPLCEASGAVRAPWDASEIVVADNEVRGTLFLLRQQPDGYLGDQTELPLPETGPEDIEAVAALDETLVVVGSHGRSGRCVPRPESRWIDLIRRTADGATERVLRLDVSPVWDDATVSVEACRRGLFVTPAPPGAEAVCAMLVRAERSAKLGDCLPLDIEGAVGVPDGFGYHRLWLGLRRPRVDNQPLLLRLAEPIEALRFDAVALIDGVGDRGVRAMTLHGDRLWMVLGPAPADFGHSALWSAPVVRLEGASSVRGRIHTDQLPPNSEALVVGEGRIVVLLDGDEGETPASACRTPSRQVVVD